MDYWAETMRDDCYLISSSGWKEAAEPREVVKVKNANGKLVWPKEDFDYLKGKRRFKSDLLQKIILIDRYFSVEQKKIDSLQNELTQVELNIQEVIDENSGEDGLLDDVIEGEDDKQKITIKSVKVRLKEINNDKNFIEEYNILQECVELLEKQAEEKKKLKTALGDLDNKLEDKYPKLKEEEIKSLVINHKWIEKLSISIQSELDYVSQTLTSRIRELALRYKTPLPKLNKEIDNLKTTVEEHLKKIGIV
jgi:type I restriction enzyme M protein